MATRKKSPAPAGKKKPPRADAEVAKTSARSTASGPTAKPGPKAVTDAASAKLEGTQAVAAAFPHNAAKPSEFADGGMRPRRAKQ